MIPAKPYMHKVMQYAISNGLRFFTWKEQRMALANYELFGCKLN